jgi:RNA polymerase sigma factor (sigma-70 family)
MATGGRHRLVGQLYRLRLLRDGGDLTDRQLLERFNSRDDEAAFAALVHRHGPMVLGVCRRVLANVHDADDAFQATFLVLVRKAVSLRSSGLLANWLYGVAYRTALKARAAAARRRAKEKQIIDMPAPQVRTEEVWHELQLHLDRELQRLPEKYRVPVVLCDLEGKTRKEAARLVGVPEGTLSTRLARARALLAKRLARHGLSGGMLAAALSRGEASACLPPPLVLATVKAAASTTMTAGVVSAKVIALTEGVLKTMLLTKLKLATAMLLAVAALGATAVFYGTQAGARDGAPPSLDKIQDSKAQASGNDKLKEENRALKQQLQKAREQTALLEAKLATLEGEAQPALYRGKPPSFWLTQLKDRDASFRIEAVRVLGTIARDNKTVIPVLIESLKDRDRTVCVETVCALREVGPPAQAAIPALLDVMNHDYSLTQGYYALQTIDPEARVTMPLLLEAMKDNSRRKRAVLILAQMNAKVLRRLIHEDQAVLPLLIESVKEKNNDVRNLAANALMQVGAEAKAAVPAILEALQQTRMGIETVRMADDPLMEALTVIDREAAMKARKP